MKFVEKEGFFKKTLSGGLGRPSFLGKGFGQGFFLKKKKKTLYLNLGGAKPPFFINFFPTPPTGGLNKKALIICFCFFVFPKGFFFPQLYFSKIFTLKNPFSPPHVFCQKTLFFLDIGEPASSQKKGGAMFMGKGFYFPRGQKKKI